MTVDTDVLIIGAGPAGLTAGYMLSKAGRDVLVIERDPAYVGGVSRTVTYKDYLFDIGGHRFASKAKAVVELWKEILPDDFVERPRLSRVFYGGKFYSYPFKTFEALSNLGPFTSAMCMASYGVARVKPVKEPETFHQWVRNQFGEKLFSIFFKSYTEKVWGMSCDEISADWAARRLTGRDPASAVAAALTRPLGLKPKGDGGEITPPIESFQYPRKGPGLMWEAARDKIVARGGTIRMDESLQSARWDAVERKWTVTTVMGSGDARTVTANHLVSSAPMSELTAALKPAPISRLHARRLRYRDVLTVALIGRTSDDFSDSCVHIHDPAVKVGRVQSFRSWSPELIPDAGVTGLGLEYFCFEGDALWTASDADLVALAKREADHIGLIKGSDVVDASVVRQAKAYPIHDEEYQHNVQMIRLDLERSFPTLHLVGRNGMHKDNDQGHAMMTAMLTAENILAGARRFDVWQVNEEAEYGEGGYSGAYEAPASERLTTKRPAA